MNSCSAFYLTHFTMLKEKVVLTSFFSRKTWKKKCHGMTQFFIDQFQGALNMVRNIGHCRAYAIVLRTNRIATSKAVVVINSA